MGRLCFGPTSEAGLPALIIEPRLRTEAFSLHSAAPSQLIPPNCSLSVVRGGPQHPLMPDFQPLPPGTWRKKSSRPRHLPASPSVAGVVSGGPRGPIRRPASACLPLMWYGPNAGLQAWGNCFVICVEMKAEV